MRMNHQTTGFHKPLFLHNTSVAVAPLPLSGAHNRAYLVSACGFAQICSAISPRTSDIHKPFDEIDFLVLNTSTSYALFLDVRNVTLSITKSYEKHGAI